ncbi:MAG: GNAT family N-acetyltransferase [Phycisphaerales bacterium]|nr:GNAT family N-acetyltransferase [Phycisphaerales bacterium]
MDPLEPMGVVPVTLRNDHVTLEPLSLDHAADIAQALDDEVFRYMPMRSSVRTPSEVQRYIQSQLARPNALAFAVIDHASGRCVGSTSYMNIRTEHRGLEIGSTWISAASRGTKINPSMKLLMLGHAFETLGAIRVELRTDARNAQSRAAIEKLGAVFEGLLRVHMVMSDGHLRDTALYSITRDEWPGTRESLKNRVLSE